MTTKTKPEYRSIPAHAVLRDLIWHVPGRHQGQTVEVAYATPGSKTAADEGAEFRRVTDRSDNSVAYGRVVRD